MSQEKGPRRFQYFDYLVLACFHIICFPHLSGHMFFLRPGWITFVVDCALWRAVVPWWWMCTQWSLIFHWLVVWNMAFMTFHSVGNVIIPTDELIFFRRGRSTTNQWWNIIIIHVCRCFMFLGVKRMDVLHQLSCRPSLILLQSFLHRRGWGEWLFRCRFPWFLTNGYFKWIF